MKNYLTILIILTIIGCSENKNKRTENKNSISTIRESEKSNSEIKIDTEKNEKINKRIELIPEPDKEERLKWEARQKELLESCFLQNPDSTINGIIIERAKSTLKILGDKTRLGGDRTYRYLTKDKKEYLKLTVYPGAYYNQVSVFEVGHSKNILKGDEFLETNSFQTEKGIKLGVSKEKIFELLGKCYKVKDSTKNILKIVYRIEMPQKTKDDFLNRYNMPIYYAEYDFENNKLNRFEFGFEYP